MKEKFTIFSPNSSKNNQLEASINFKKSPNKFAVYEPESKPKETPRYTGYQSFSSTNLDQVKKISNEYSNLRQTLSYKSDLESFIHDEQK